MEAWLFTDISSKGSSVNSVKLDVQSLFWPGLVPRNHHSECLVLCHVLARGRVISIASGRTLVVQNDRFQGVDNAT